MDQVQSQSIPTQSNIMKLKPKDVTVENASIELMTRAKKAFEPMAKTLHSLQIEVSTENDNESKKAAFKDFKTQQAKFRSTMNAVRASHRKALEAAQTMDEKRIAKTNLIVARLTIQLLNQLKVSNTEVSPASKAEIKQAKPGKETPVNKSCCEQKDDSKNDYLVGKCVKDITVENAPVELINKASLAFQIALSSLQPHVQAIDSADTQHSKKVAREKLKIKRKEIQTRLNGARISARQAFKLAPKGSIEKQQSKVDLVVARLTQQMFNQHGKSPVSSPASIDMNSKEFESDNVRKDIKKVNKKMSNKVDKKNRGEKMLQIAMEQVSDIQQSLESARQALDSAENGPDKSQARKQYVQQRKNALVQANLRRKSAREAFDATTETGARKQAKQKLVLARMTVELLRKAFQQENQENQENQEKPENQEKQEYQEKREKRENQEIIGSEEDVHQTKKERKANLVKARMARKEQAMKNRQARKRQVEAGVNAKKSKKACKQVAEGTIAENIIQNAASEDWPNHSTELQNVRSITVDNCPAGLLGRATARHSDIEEQLEPLRKDVRSADSKQEKLTARKALQQKRKSVMKALQQERKLAREAFDASMSSANRCDLPAAKGRLVMARLALHFMNQNK